ncbi:histone-lysine N-methyltransferase Su(var)3-9-like [Planococcus citri]|uniref:histone-lysine N-methyltransferase Su(var)3-9-like n=1 Tax=Planococcus citri TaxID=170843 RepID=UPI0031F77DDA
MSSTTHRVEIDEIIDDKIAENETLFQVRLKNPPVKFWLPCDKMPSEDLIIKYVIRLIPTLPSGRREVARNFDRIYDLVKKPVKNELNNLMNSFRTLRGLELPFSNYYFVLKSLQNLIHERITDYEKIASVRRDILVEEMIKERQSQLENLKSTEIDINIISDHRKPIKVVNDYDLEKFPSSLNYINEQIFTKSGEKKMEKVIIGCECKSSEECRRSSCSHYDFERDVLSVIQPTKKAKAGEHSNLVVVPYDDRGRSLNMYPKFECNELCKCDANCSRKVVQKGSNVELEIFRTFSGCGWGVRTLEAIEEGTFVCKYAGEILLWEEAKKRDCHEYLFDSEYSHDWNKGHSRYIIDGYRYGNISRFVNHNCEPNLSVQIVCIENISVELGEICFFAAKDIAANEELSINYKDLILRHHQTCKCSTCYDYYE